MITEGNEISDVKKALSLSEEVFSKHLPGYKLGVGNTNSPFRQDKIPSFSITWKNGKWLFKDWGDSSYHGDVIHFIKLYYGVDFNQAVRKIVKDFDCKRTFAEEKLHIKKPKHQKDSKQVELDIKSRHFNSNEINWWKEFGISFETLKKYNVSAVEYLFFNKTPVKCKTSTYCFREMKENKLSLKIYSPFTPETKWYSSHNSSVLQGWQQLPNEGKLLIVSKSLKDSMLLFELGYNAVSPNSETQFIKKNVLEQLLKRFKRIIIFWDNDAPGLREGQKWAEKHQLEYIYLPIGGPKDISDYFKVNGLEKSKEILKQLINGKLDK